MPHVYTHEWLHRYKNVRVWAKAKAPFNERERVQQLADIKAAYDAARTIESIAELDFVTAVECNAIRGGYACLIYVDWP